MGQKIEFGFYPDPLQIKAGPITIRPLAALKKAARAVLTSDGVENDWIYAPASQVQNMQSGQIREMPYASRVFGLPKTHSIEHAQPTSESHLEFHLWALSFFIGMRLTATDRGFLDATPLRRGTLVDFVLSDTSLASAVDIAEVFWDTNRANPIRARRFAAAVHALFIGCNRQNLAFERFIYFYTAIDACYRLTQDIRQLTGGTRHGDRIKVVCDEFGIAMPPWGDPTLGNPEVSVIRNNTLHEALFMDAPLGFATRKKGTNQNLLLEMRTLTCRLLVALIGGDSTAYVRSPVNTGQTHFLDL